MPQKLWWYAVLGLVGYAVVQGLRQAIARAVPATGVTGLLTSGIAGTIAIAEEGAGAIASLTTPLFLAAEQAAFPAGLEFVSPEEAAGGVADITEEYEPGGKYYEEAVLFAD